MREKKKFWERVKTGLLLIWFILCITLGILVFMQCQQAFEEEGGIRSMVVKAGKVIKDVYREVNEGEPRDGKDIN